MEAARQALAARRITDRHPGNAGGKPGLDKMHGTASEAMEE